MVRHFENIDKRYISSDAESRKEQDGAKHFRIEATMAEFLSGCSQKWKRKDSFITLSLSEDGWFYRSCLSKQPLEPEFNGE